MRAAVYHGIRKVETETVPTPEAGPGQAVLKVGAAGICGTDLRIYEQGHHRIPPGTTRILGHEFAGEIVAVGEGVRGLQPGMRVAIAPNVGCGTCTQCVAGWTNLCEHFTAFGISLDGGFGEYVLVTADAIRQGNVVPIPDHVHFEVAALAEPLSCCFNGQEAIGLGRDDVVLIVGDGPIGIMHLLLARLSGARRVIVSGHSPARRKQAEQLGADRTLDPRQEDLGEAVLELSGGEGAGVVIVAAAAPGAQEEALELAARRGRINYFAGLPKDEPFIRFNSNLVHYKQLRVTGSTGSNVRQFRSSVNLIAAGRIKLDPLVGARLPLDRIGEGIERAKAGEEMRILVEPSA